MERIELLLLLIFTLSFHCLRAGSEGGLAIGKVHQHCSIEERDFLLNFKQSLFDPRLILSDWNIVEDCCTWNGVRCSNITNHVIKLDLSHDKFSSGALYAKSLVSSLFRLQHLEYLSLSGITFNQTIISNAIDSLTKLRHLDLSLSGFIGIIPPNLGNLVSLRYLDLSWNDLVIETSLDPWLFRLKHLRYLSLAHVHIKQTSILQKFDALVNMRYLDLFSTELQGVIPPHLGNLTNLCYLDLSANSLFASNFLWISRLNSLKYLDMSNVNLTFATNWLQEIKVLPALSYLNLSFCSLQTLPTLLPYSNFSSTIETFDLSYNHLNGSFPKWVGQFKSLKTLHLNSNNFTGPISLASSNLLCDLDTLNLNNNNFIELIDDERDSKCKEYKMTSLEMSMNQITGSIPQWIGKMKNLKYLNLGNNLLNGSIPQSLGQLMNLAYLDLSSNDLHESLLDVNFANLSQLKRLDLSENHLDFNMISSNWIPPFQISRLFLSSCHIGPHFPLWLQNQKFLTMLDLSNCGISDIIPSWFWNISSQIKYLNMSQNAIRGELPVSLNIASAAIIDLYSNLLEGLLPGLMNYVYYVSFSNNKFSGGVELYLNANMSFLSVLDLSQNHFSGRIPDSLCQMSSIFLLDLSYNNLSGEIPKCHGNISSYKMLKFISFAGNNLRGSVPHWIGNLPMLLSLHLNNNAFHGEMPFLQNCSKLITLDLGQNFFTGNIPLWIGDILLSLKILRLRSNKFHGSIPSELSKLKELQILDLADNFLSGPIPKSFKFLNSMAMQKKRLEPLIPYDGVIFSNQWRYIAHVMDIGCLAKKAIFDSLMIDIKGIDREFTDILSLMILIDLSCNNLNGEVSVELMSLLGLISLNLSSNNFTGKIPINIGVMQSLESLDLSRNHLSGEIPESIVKLSKLNFLNLSYNQLSGRIPMGTQLDTFNESSYYENPELCGKPLLKSCEGDEHKIHSEGSDSHDDDDDDNFGLFLSMGLGFVVGLWSVLGTLLLKRSWAITYFQLLDYMIDSIYVFVAIKKKLLV